MTDPLTRFVKALNDVNSTLNYGARTFSSLTSNPKHFPKVATVVLLSSGLIGLGLMEIVTTKRENNFQNVYRGETNNDERMSEDESIVRAMIENAKSSSPLENLENAAMAQKNFMLIPFDDKVTNEKRDRKFIEKISHRSKEIRNQNDNSE
mmetsp:Transcript_8469/g.12707  ORF Transcript_8469/g.12707 Transcript_8469/m.12707 type:complete len:151 (+) Transcript_8469:75-527(+)